MPTSIIFIYLVFTTKIGSAIARFEGAESYIMFAYDLIYLNFLLILRYTSLIRYEKVILFLNIALFTLLAMLTVSRSMALSGIFMLAVVFFISKSKYKALILIFLFFLFYYQYQQLIYFMGEFLIRISGQDLIMFSEEPRLHEIKYFFDNSSNLELLFGKGVGGQTPNPFYDFISGVSEKYIDIIHFSPLHL